MAALQRVPPLALPGSAGILQTVYLARSISECSGSEDVVRRDEFCDLQSKTSYIVLLSIGPATLACSFPCR